MPAVMRQAWRRQGPARNTRREPTGVSSRGVQPRSTFWSGAAAYWLVLGRVTKQLVSIACFLISPEIVGRVVGVTLAPNGGQPAIEGVRDGDLAQLLGLFKLNQLLPVNGIPAISGSPVPGSQLFPRTVSSQRLPCSIRLEAGKYTSRICSASNGVAFLATLGRLAGVEEKVWV